MKYTGMTVNERLWVSGLFEEFESAIRNKNVKRAVEILRSVELDDESIRANLEVSGIEANLYDNIIKNVEDPK
jgi:hypothetical protein